MRCSMGQETVRNAAAGERFHVRRIAAGTEMSDTDPFGSPHWSSAPYCSFWELPAATGAVVRPIPKTYPVTGKVVVTQGQFSAADCMIQFEPENPELMAQGIVAKDGTFSLNTIFHEDRLPGATEGPSCRPNHSTPDARRRQYDAGCDPSVVQGRTEGKLLHRQSDRRQIGEIRLCERLSAWRRLLCAYP